MACFRGANFSIEENKSEIVVNSQEAYKVYDTVNIVQNLCNNLLCQKKFPIPTIYMYCSM